MTGVTIGAADALYAGLADHYVPADALELLHAILESTPGAELVEAIAAFAEPFKGAVGPGRLEAERAAIDRHFGAGSVAAIVASLEADAGPFARETITTMASRSPLMMCVTHEMIRRGAPLHMAGCLRMERALVRRVFENGEVIEGVRALVIDKDNAPKWSPPSVAQVGDEVVARWFEPVWPEHAHPLRHLS